VPAFGRADKFPYVEIQASKLRCGRRFAGLPDLPLTRSDNRITELGFSSQHGQKHLRGKDHNDDCVNHLLLIVDNRLQAGHPIRKCRVFWQEK